MDPITKLLQGVTALKEWQVRVEGFTSRIRRLTTAQTQALAIILARYASDQVIATVVLAASVNNSKGAKLLGILEHGLIEVEGVTRGSQGQA